MCTASFLSSFDGRCALRSLFRRLPGKRSGAVSGAEERPTTSHYQLAEVRRVPESVTHLAWHYVASLTAFCECIISSQMFTDAQLQQP